MKRHLLILSALFAALVCIPITFASAGDGHGHSGRGRSGQGHGHGVSHGRGFSHGHGFGHGRGFGGLGFIGGGFDYGWDISELYRQLYNNLPYFALHPPVYYSQPVPRTYGYSPFAYPPGVMTPEIVEESKPVTIINPYVPSTKPASAETTTDRAASTTTTPEPLVIVNPFVTPTTNVARSSQ